MQIVKCDRLSVFATSAVIEEKNFAVSILLNHSVGNAETEAVGTRITLTFEQAWRLSKVLNAAVELGRATLK